MSWQKSFRSLGIPAIVICPALVIFSGLPPLLPAQSYPELKVSLTFPPTEERGAPPRTAGGGTRRGGSSSCTQRRSETPLTALMPSNNVGTMLAANPTFFWYVPKTTAKSAEFILFNNKGNEVYRTTFTPTGTPGIIKLSLPATTSLEVGKIYEWQLALICTPQDQSNERSFDLVEGFVERAKLRPDLKAKLVQAAPLEQAKLYAKAGIWQETLTILARLRTSNPTEFEELLKSVGLSKIAQAPFVECCTVENSKKKTKTEAPVDTEPSFRQRH